MGICKGEQKYHTLNEILNRYLAHVERIPSHVVLRSGHDPLPASDAEVGEYAILLISARDVLNWLP